MIEVWEAWRTTSERMLQRRLLLRLRTLKEARVCDMVEVQQDDAPDMPVRSLSDFAWYRDQGRKARGE